MAKKGNISKYAVTAITLAVMVAGVWYYMRVATPYRGEEAVRIYIPRTATVEAAKDSIIAALGSPLGNYVTDMWNKNISVSHGSYVVNRGEKAWQIARTISKGQQTPISLTFNNIRTFDQLAERISARMDFTKEEFIAAADSIAKAEGLSRQEIEAQFLPDKYEMYWSASPEALIKRLRSYYSKFWNDERQEKARKLGLTPLEVSIVASITEEESNKNDEHPTIARLYLNRLESGMKLQADPTVKFAGGDFSVTRITGDMLQIDSRYNTYKYAGLPPGIIRLPEARTLDAVLNAPKHNYIYMCATTKHPGYHDFTADYDQHLKNAAAYRSAVYGKK